MGVDDIERRHVSVASVSGPTVRSAGAARAHYDRNPAPGLRLHVPHQSHASGTAATATVRAAAASTSDDQDVILGHGRLLEARRAYVLEHVDGVAVVDVSARGAGVGAVTDYDDP
jgi:hypothetical protein